MLDHAGLATLYLVDAVVIVRGTWVDILGLVDRGVKIRLSSLLREIGARNLDLKRGFVRCGRYDVKIL